MVSLEFQEFLLLHTWIVVARQHLCHIRSFVRFSTARRPFLSYAYAGDGAVAVYFVGNLARGSLNRR